MKRKTHNMHRRTMHAPYAYPNPPSMTGLHPSRPFHPRGGRCRPDPPMEILGRMTKTQLMVALMDSAREVDRIRDMSGIEKETQTDPEPESGPESESEPESESDPESESEREECGEDAEDWQRRRGLISGIVGTLFATAMVSWGTLANFYGD